MSGSMQSRTLLCLARLEPSGATADGIERALAGLPGVSRVHVNRLTEMAYVEHDALHCSREHLAETLRAAERVARQGRAPD